MTSVMFTAVMKIVRRQKAQSEMQAVRARVRDRVVTRLSTRRLDRALAAGAPPESTPALALRAQRLTALDRRRSMAAGLRRGLRDTRGDSPVAHPNSRVAFSERRISAAAEKLGMLADRLVDPSPVAASGAARTWILLTDGTGPLYNPRSCASLADEAAKAAASLRPWDAAAR